MIALLIKSNEIGYQAKSKAWVRISCTSLNNSIRNCCRNPSFGLTTKAKGLQGSRPRGNPGVKAKRLQGCTPRRSPGVTSHTTGSVRKCEGVWGSEPSHSQDNSHFGRWSPGGLSKLQRAISGVKTPWLMTFFISLKSPWNVNV
jgi:hypothetical protein